MLWQVNIHHGGQYNDPEYATIMNSENKQIATIYSIDTALKITNEHNEIIYNYLKNNQKEEGK